MSYSNFLKAQGKSGKPPTIEKVKMSVEEKARAAAGLCIKCGLKDAEQDNYVCIDCQSEHTLEDIQNEIQALRQRLLGARQA